MEIMITKPERFIITKTSSIIMDLLRFCTIMAIFATTDGYGTGSPLSACINMLPGHSVNAQSSASPYTLEILNGATEYEPGGTTTIQGNFFWC